MTQLVFVFLLGGVGCLLRFKLNDKVTFDFPLSTVIVNLVGCLFLGLLYSLEKKGIIIISKPMHIALMAGLMGGLTTYSGFGLDFLKLMDKGQSGLALTYILTTMGGGFVLVYVGHYIGAKL